MKNGYRKTYLISNDVVTISYDAGNALSFPTKYVIEDNITMRPVTGGNPGHTYNMATDNFEGDTP